MNASYDSGILSNEYPALVRMKIMDHMTPRDLVELFEASETVLDGMPELSATMDIYEETGMDIVITTPSGKQSRFDFNHEMVAIRKIFKKITLRKVSIKIHCKKVALYADGTFSVLRFFKIDKCECIKLESTGKHLLDLTPMNELFERLETKQLIVDANVLHFPYLRRRIPKVHFSHGTGLENQHIADHMIRMSDSVIMDKSDFGEQFLNGLCSSWIDGQSKAKYIRIKVAGWYKLLIEPEERIERLLKNLNAVECEGGWEIVSKKGERAHITRSEDIFIFKVL